MKFLDLFSGIGGFRLGMEMASHECVGYVEWDKYARKSYEAIHDTEGEWTWNDVSTIDYRELPRADTWTFGFPCQDISVAGNQQGFNGNRSSLFFAVTKRLRQIKEWDPERMPTFLLVENVKNFLSVNNGWDFLATQIELDEIGYNMEWQVLNSKGYGVAQNRERVFIVGHLRGKSTRKVFPIRETNGVFGADIKRLGHSKYFRRVLQTFDITGSCETLDTMQGGNRQPCVYLPGTNEYRKLTPRECWRLQGFPDWAFDKAAEVNSNSQLYKQAGNSVTVNVIYEIAKRLGVDE